MGDNPFRNLPSVNEVLEAEPVRALEGQHAHEHIVAAVRDELADADVSFDPDELARYQSGRGHGPPAGPGAP